VAARHGDRFAASSRFQGELCDLTVGRRRLRLLKPMTFMNESGRSVAAVAHFYRIDPGAILIAHDEIDLPPGTVRLKRGGGDGGHRGLRDVIPALGGGGFARLRIGVGHPGTREQVVGYVLRAAPAEEQSLMDEALDRSLALIEDIVAGDTARVMNVLHRKSSAAETSDDS
jgi:PTH1 family peptidyl-tRNA hydrolase